VQSNSAIDIEEFVKDLTITKKEKNSYERSLNCADDPRPSAKTVGSVGVAILCVLFGLIVLADCSLFVKWFFKRMKKNVTNINMK
jgi:hypothetical protein